mmetsp:Transcript_38558/g.95515  ORF Transcript_38558/g.95515 Transcript_38558/m.95515 type:complete len:201 (+) Transcript_38558:217-819(+)
MASRHSSSGVSRVHRKSTHRTRALHVRPAVDGLRVIVCFHAPSRCCDRDGCLHDAIELGLSRLGAQPDDDRPPRGVEQLEQLVLGHEEVLRVQVHIPLVPRGEEAERGHECVRQLVIHLGFGQCAVSEQHVCLHGAHHLRVLVKGRIVEAIFALLHEFLVPAAEHGLQRAVQHRAQLCAEGLELRQHALHLCAVQPAALL